MITLQVYIVERHFEGIGHRGWTSRKVRQKNQLGDQVSWLRNT